MTRGRASFKYIPSLEAGNKTTQAFRLFLVPFGTEPEVTEAYREWENRKQLDAIDKALEQIEAALTEVMPE
ncbi:hypothetical protein [Nostoc sp.]